VPSQLGIGLMLALGVSVKSCGDNRFWQLTASLLLPLGLGGGGLNQRQRRGYGEESGMESWHFSVMCLSYSLVGIVVSLGGSTYDMLARLYGSSVSLPSIGEYV
jgi:hypothetical protein